MYDLSLLPLGSARLHPLHPATIVDSFTSGWAGCGQILCGSPVRLCVHSEPQRELCRHQFCATSAGTMGRSIRQRCPPRSLNEQSHTLHLLIVAVGWLDAGRSMVKRRSKDKEKGKEKEEENRSSKQGSSKSIEGLPRI